MGKKEFVEKIKKFIEKMNPKDVIIFGLLVISWLTIFHVYFSLSNDLKEAEDKISNFQKILETSINFDSLIYVNNVEPIFTQTANEVNSQLTNFFQKGGVQITEKRYEEIKKIVEAGKTKIQSIAPPSEEAKNLKEKIINFYDRYLLALTGFIGLTKEELDEIKNNKGELYQKMEAIDKEKSEIEGLFRMVKERYTK